MNTNDMNGQMAVLDEMSRLVTTEFELIWTKWERARKHHKLACTPPPPVPTQTQVPTNTSGVFFKLGTRHI